MSVDAVKWNKRASMLYAVGIWTMFGTYGYYRYQHRNDPPVEMPKEEEDTRPNVKTVKTSHLSTTIVYKEDFVPYSTRFLNLFRPTTNSCSGCQDDEE
ncbi:hypothetical protein MHYP_G00357300 [Metynnis hypsauchen]